MSRKADTYSREIKETLRALRRAARRALELGLKTGTAVYVVENGKIVDLTKRKPAGTMVKTTKPRTTKPGTTKPATTKPKPRRSVN
ncbi:MAG TPA: hypothetical protein VJ749_08765 [Pyrinomonadaceae bacterium]|nr:hypothetical protein [Pyrinomonadaceae bacterium]